jgi:hypothetical protein
MKNYGDLITHSIISTLKMFENIVYTKELYCIKSLSFHKVSCRNYYFYEFFGSYKEHYVN